MAVLRENFMIGVYTNARRETARQVRGFAAITTRHFVIDLAPQNV